jgi:hypothetical protein
LNGLVKTKVVIEHAEGIALAVDQKWKCEEKILTNQSILSFLDF